jgi:hypothetical protein
MRPSSGSTTSSSCGTGHPGGRPCARHRLRDGPDNTRGGAGSLRRRCVRGRLDGGMIPPCPQCDGADGEPVQPVAPESRLRWFRCRGCGHLWSVAPPISSLRSVFVSERAVPTIVPGRRQNDPSRANGSQNRLIGEVKETEEFAKKNDDVREADFRLANRRLQPLGHLTADCKYM